MIIQDYTITDIKFNHFDKVRFLQFIRGFKILYDELSHVVQ